LKFCAIHIFIKKLTDECRYYKFFQNSLSCRIYFSHGFVGTAIDYIPIKYVFLLVAIVVLSGLYPAIRLIDNKSEAEG